MIINNGDSSIDLSILKASLANLQILFP